MNRILLLLGLLLLPFRTSAFVTNVDARVTFTNALGIVSGNTITIDGDIRRVTNGVLNNASTWIQGTNTPSWASTNVWLHMSVYKPAGVDSVFTTNTSNIIVRGSLKTNTFLNVTLSSGVGTVFYITNVWADSSALMFPVEALPNEPARTNDVSGLFGVMNDISSRSTNYLQNGIRAMSNYLDRISQQISSNKMFYATTNNGGQIDGSRLVNIVWFNGSNGTVYALMNLGGTNSGWIGSLTNGTLYSNMLAFSRLTNAFAMHGTVYQLSNGLYITPTLTNPVSLHLVNYGNAIRSEGTGGNSFQAGSNAQSTALMAISLGNSALSSGINGAAIGNFATNTGVAGFAGGTLALVTNDYGTAVGYASRAGLASVTLGTGSGTDGAYSITIGEGSENDATNSILIGTELALGANAYGSVNVGGGSLSPYGVALGWGSTSIHSNSAAIGPIDHAGNGVTTTETNQIRLGTANHTVSVPGVLSALDTTNTHSVGTNRLEGDLSLGGNYSISSVANGRNTLDMSTNITIYITGAPSAAWTLGGIKAGASAPRNNQWLKLWNVTGYDSSVVNNDGGESTAAYRILTPSGSDILWQNGTCITLMYRAAVARWYLESWTYANGRLASTVSGAGTGSTNYTLIASSGEMYLGSSNVNISAVMGTTAGTVLEWTATVTNLSAIDWGIKFSSVTNRWRFWSAAYGSNAPSVLTNGTALELKGRSLDTNTTVSFKYFAPAF